MDPGLCATCRHAQRLDAPRSVFWLCGRARVEPERFARYPRLPVVRCAGHEPGARGEDAGSSTVK